jgi:hypothetical protein
MPIFTLKNNLMALSDGGKRTQSSLQLNGRSPPPTWMYYLLAKVLSWLKRSPIPNISFIRHKNRIVIGLWHFEDYSHVLFSLSDKQLNPAWGFPASPHVPMGCTLISRYFCHALLVGG